MHESVQCDHCDEEFAPEELTVVGPPAGGRGGPFNLRIELWCDVADHSNKVSATSAADLGRSSGCLLSSCLQLNSDMGA